MPGGINSMASEDLQGLLYIKADSPQVEVLDQQVIDVVLSQEVPTANWL